ncbi:Catabolite control protein A [Neomoorella glycerini]|uniref:Catabolite control protein A n=1 Tax=Neomoorella glycerini TaxID=55779 RepID=A0A6I5ZQR1_9FIRM|nr:LacI family DNA-binding transcriptional regulator [Moorella glycerini]QGP92334.1 Catabolite control protein A [Moorella glycerini]
MEPTIKAIAAELGISVATVSKALNGYNDVSDETRERVLALARKQGYVPNALARGLLRKRSQTIGLILPDIRDPFFPEVARGVEDAANERGYRVIYCNTDRDQEKELAAVRNLLEKRVDGFILNGNYLQSGYLEWLRAREVPFVLLRRRLAATEISFVDVDNISGAYMATTHLIRLGHRQIGFINLPVTSYAHAPRGEGFQKAMADYGLEVNDRWVREGDYTTPGGCRLALDILGSMERPTAIFAANDRMALGILEAAGQLGLKVPGDLAVIGYDGLEIGELSFIGLSTVSQPRYEMGYLSLELLANMIEGQETPGRQVILPVQMTVRRTCGGGAS